MIAPPNSSIAKLLGVSAGTLYNHIPDLRELRTSRSAPQLDDGDQKTDAPAPATVSS